MFRSLAVCCIAVAVSSTAVAQTQSRSQAPVRTASAETRAELAAYKQSYQGDCYSNGGSSYNPNGPKPMGQGPMWPATGNRDCSRFYHYPYVFYPQNFYGSEYFRSSDSMYYRYPAEMQIPVYNRQWHNEYPSEKRYHWGHHFLTDVF
jgi:hypothetical protein